MNEADEQHGGGEESEGHGGRHRKHKKHAAHGGAWKVAYADFVTALLALFIVLWVLGQDDKVKKAVQAYFKDPTGYMKVGGAPFTVGKGATLSLSQGAVKEAIEKKLEEQMNKIKDALAENEAFQSVQDQVVIEVTDEGIRMEFRDAAKFNFFQVGSAMVSPQLDEIFRAITPEIINMSYPVVIEGHTDRRPYGTKDYTNWELSADRANASRRELVAGGIDDRKIVRVVGLASSIPLDRGDPASPVNRRIAIVVLNREAAESALRDPAQVEAKEAEDVGEALAPRKPPAQ